MDREALVAGFDAVAAELRRRYGPVALLLLMTPDFAVGEMWHVVVSAKRLDGLGRAEAIPRVTRLLRETLDRRLWSYVTRVSVLPTSDPFVQAMGTRYPTSRAAVELEACSVLGIEIPLGVVVRSRKLAA